MKLEEDKIVWTCTPSIECGYDDRLRKPREVILKQRKHGVWYGHSFCRETGEIDIDSNATIFARENNCFETKEEADNHFEQYLIYEIEGLQEQLKDFQNRRHK